MSVRLRLGALLRYTIDYTKRDEYAPLLCVFGALLIGGSPIFIETTVKRGANKQPPDQTYVSQEADRTEIGELAAS